VQDRAQWWREAALYQIYVRSWRDSNGDGAGDLTGICGELDYLAWLGIDGIWLSPTMPSPNTDWGYDVSDYCGVDPALGTTADMDKLIEEARQRGIAVLLDLVPNHTSSAHPWFIDALGSKTSDHRNYYVWAPPKPGGGLPNNWLDATGAPAWSYDAASGEYYLHNFLPTQPDLNWWEPRVHAEFERILRYWFDRGVAGFRIDVAHGLYKDASLRDNPRSQPGDHPATLRGPLRTVYSSHRPEVHGLYRRWRALADSYEPQRALLGETWEFNIERLGDYYGRDVPELHMGFNFPFAFSELRSPDLATIVEATVSALPAGATPVWTASNHDIGRFPTRWCKQQTAAVKAALVVLTTLPGALVLYYGDEIGMPDVEVPPERQLDEMSLAHPGQPSRDRCRTPMHWSPGDNAGFAPAGAIPWLPLGEHGTTNVKTQRDDPGSVLNFCHELLALRRSGQIARPGQMERVLLDDRVWAFRVGGATTVANLSPRPASRDLGTATALSVLASTRASRKGTKAGPRLDLGPWEALVLGGSIAGRA
jgi:alpha-glucosidase